MVDQSRTRSEPAAGRLADREIRRLQLGLAEVEIADGNEFHLRPNLDRSEFAVPIRESDQGGPDFGEVPVLKLALDPLDPVDLASRFWIPSHDVSNICEVFIVTFFYNVSRLAFDTPHDRYNDSKIIVIYA